MLSARGSRSLSWFGCAAGLGLGLGLALAGFGATALAAAVTIADLPADAVDVSTASPCAGAASLDQVLGRGSECFQPPGQQPAEVDYFRSVWYRIRFDGTRLNGRAVVIEHPATATAKVTLFEPDGDGRFRERHDGRLAIPAESRGFELFPAFEVQPSSGDSVYYLHLEEAARIPVTISSADGYRVEADRARLSGAVQLSVLASLALFALVLGLTTHDLSYGLILANVLCRAFYQAYVQGFLRIVAPRVPSLIGMTQVNALALAFAVLTLAFIYQFLSWTRRSLRVRRLARLVLGVSWVACLLVSALPPVPSLLLLRVTVVTTNLFAGYLVLAAGWPRTRSMKLVWLAGCLSAGSIILSTVLMHLDFAAWSRLSGSAFNFAVIGYLLLAAVGERSREQATADRDTIAKLNGELAKRASDLAEDVGRKTRLLHEADKRAALSSIAGTVAHEINSPLSTVHILSQRLEREVTKLGFGGVTSDLCRRLHANIERIFVITNGLKYYSSTHHDEDESLLNFAEVVNEVVRFAREVYRAHGITFEVSMPVAVAEVVGRRDALAQLVANMIDYGLAQCRGDRGAPMTIDLAVSSASVRLALECEATPTDAGAVDLRVELIRDLVDQHRGRLEVAADQDRLRLVIELPRGGTGWQASKTT